MRLHVTIVCLVLPIRAWAGGGDLFAHALLGLLGLVAVAQGALYFVCAFAAHIWATTDGRRTVALLAFIAASPLGHVLVLFWPWWPTVEVIFGVPLGISLLGFGTGVWLSGWRSSVIKRRNLTLDGADGPSASAHS